MLIKVIKAKSLKKKFFFLFMLKLEQMLVKSVKKESKEKNGKLLIYLLVLFEPIIP